jgi:hypothetical protein
MRSSNLSNYILKINMRKKPWWIKNPVFIKIITFSQQNKTTKHNYITTAAIRIRSLAAGSWCLEPLRRGEELAKKFTANRKFMKEFELVCKYRMAGRKQLDHPCMDVGCFAHTRKKCLFDSSYPSVSNNRCIRAVLNGRISVRSDIVIFYENLSKNSIFD